MERISVWQQKKEYETTAQWQKRVTEENRNEILPKIIAEVKNEFIDQWKPEEPIVSLGRFDADYGIFPISVNGVENTFYVEVPNSEAQYLNGNWDKVIITPEYDIIDNYIVMSSCKFTLDGKVYETVESQVNIDNNNDIAINLPPLEFDLEVSDAKPEIKHSPSITIDRSLDRNIPVVEQNNTNTFAVIIGNENYKRVAKVEHALNDANIFAEYCTKTLGLPNTNVRSYKDATYGMMIMALDDIKQIAQAYNGDLNVIFYYAGHGVPNESNRSAFLLPVDVDGSRTYLCLGVDKLYQELASLDARSVIVFMDACFSGAQRGEGMLASARGVALKVIDSAPQGNMVVFTAATSD